MTQLEIIIAPDPRLKLKCAPVKVVDKACARLMDDMLESMYAANGIGLAAPQVGVTQRIIVVDVSRDDEEPRPVRMANPEIVWQSEEDLCTDEGCLSLPEQFAEVTRPESVRVRYIDHQNEIREIAATGLLARCIQHEMDHLEGVLFVDHLSQLKRGMILKKLVKAKRQQVAESA